MKIATLNIDWAKKNQLNSKNLYIYLYNCMVAKSSPAANNSLKPRPLRGRVNVWHIVTSPRPQIGPA